MVKKPDLNHVIDSSHVGIIATDTKCRITFINRYANKSLAIGAKDATGAYISDILPVLGASVNKCIETAQSQLAQKIPGKDINLIGNITPILNRQAVEGAVCSFLELNEYEYSVSKLESYKNLSNELEAIFDSSAYGNWLCDGEGTILKLNKAAEQLNGVKAKEVVGKNALHLVEKGIVDRSCTGEVLKTKRRVKIIQHMKKTGKDIMSTGTPVFDQEGNIFRVVANQFDITGLNTIRKELDRSRLVTEKFRDELSGLNMLDLKRQEIIAESKKMKQVLKISFKLARIGASEILILGESGVGKGLLAKFIHNNSRQSKKPFIQINCAALPENLLEAELFGYEKGAFTGAAEKGKVGLIELAKNGTLFLDEIGDVPLSIQTKLLTYLDDYLVRPLGGTKQKTINCAIIAATNQDLLAMIKKGSFREDLFYRLNSFTVKIPPLRDRKEDIFELTHMFLQKYNKKYNISRRVSSRLMKTLCTYPFPGNVRELESIIKQALVMSENEVLDDFIITTIGTDCNQLNEPYNNSCNLIEKIRNVERELLKDALVHNRTTRDMASYLGISQSAVVKKLKKHRLTKQSTIPIGIN